MTGTDDTTMEALVLEVVDRFVAADRETIDAAVHTTLERFARFSGADMAHLLLVDEEAQTFTVTHEWQGPGLSPRADAIRTLPLTNLAPSLRAGDLLVIPDVHALPADLPVRRHLLGVGIISMASAPLRRDDRTIGAIGLEHASPHAWTDEELKLLRLVAVAFQAAVTRRRNLTEQRALQERVRMAERMEAVGKLAGGVAHDFNNMLAAILGTAELARRSLADPQALASQLDTIQEAALRAAELTRQLLMFSRRQPIRLEPTVLADVVDETLTMVRRLLPENIVVEHLRAPGSSAIRGDRAQLEQICMNLAVNARDAMPRGGTLTFETRRVRLGESGQSTSATGHCEAIQLRVSDTGEGIPAEHLDHIFEPFYTTKEGASGTGLGLATVYGIVGTHSAGISVDSERGRGTTFRIRFPAPADEPTAPVQSEPVAEDELGGHETILVAEDQELVRRTVCGLLREAGYRVVAATDGAQALDLFLADPQLFDLLLLDVVMPELGGIEVSKRAREVRPELPILLASGYSEALLTDVVSERLISKPYSRTELLRALRALLDT